MYRHTAMRQSQFNRQSPYHRNTASPSAAYPEPLTPAHSSGHLSRASVRGYGESSVERTTDRSAEHMPVQRGRIMPKIYLVDDDENILTSVSMFLEGEGYEVRKFHDGVSALSALKASPPNLAIFDVKMPRMDGLELLKRLRQTSNVPVIFLTSKDDDIDEAIGLNLGADDYITKPFSQRLLGERIKAVLRRSQFGGLDAAMPVDSDNSVMRRGQLMLDPNRHACSWNGSAVRLTVTEFLILEALAKRPGYVKSRDQLMDAAYEDQVYVDDRTIDSHIKRLRKKFRKTDKSFDGIETLYGVGYKYKEA